MTTTTTTTTTEIEISDYERGRLYALKYNCTIAAIAADAERLYDAALADATASDELLDARQAMRDALVAGDVARALALADEWTRGQIIGAVMGADALYIAYAWVGGPRWGGCHWRADGFERLTPRQVRALEPAGASGIQAGTFMPGRHAAGYRAATPDELLEYLSSPAVRERLAQEAGAARVEACAAR